MIRMSQDFGMFDKLLLTMTSDELPTKSQANHDRFHQQQEENEHDMISSQVTQWKMNPAIDSIYKLVFISGNDIYIYELVITMNKNKKCINITVSINRLSNNLIDNEAVVYAGDYDGYINIIYYKYINNMLSSYTAIHRMSNIIFEKSDNYVWSSLVGKAHNGIVIGSNTHLCKYIMQGHDNNIPCDENKSASVSIDGRVACGIKKRSIDFNNKINANENPCLYLNDKILCI